MIIYNDKSEIYLTRSSQNNILINDLLVSFALISVTIIKGYYPALVSAPILSKFVRANSIKMPPKYKLVLLIALVLVATSLAGRTKEHPKHPPSLQEQQHTPHLDSYPPPTHRHKPPHPVHGAGEEPTSIPRKKGPRRPPN